LDEKGRFQINSSQKVHFAVSGPGTVAAVGSGDGESPDLYSGDAFTLFHGRALAVVRTSRNPGQIKLAGSADGLAASSVALESKPVTLPLELR
jgi:beta-galactosidase